MHIWQMANEIVDEVYKITQSFPRSEDYALTGQLRRAAISICGNIAEAFGRSHAKDKLNFYYFSRGSSFETFSHLKNAITVGYIVQDDILELQQKLLSEIESINKIIKTLKNSQPS